MSRTGGVSQVTLTGTSFTGNQAHSGGSLFNYSSGGTATVNATGAIFDNNAASYAGGAVGNYCELAGGLGTVNLNGCTFTDNQSGNRGGAVSNTALKGAVASVNATACRFEGNHSTIHGGAMHSLCTSPTGGSTASNLQVSNCVFYANTAAQRGAALYNDAATGAPSTYVVTNSTFANNISLTGSGLFNTSVGTGSLASATLRNNIFWNNSCTDTLSRYLHNIGVGSGITMLHNSMQWANFANNEVGTGTLTDGGGNLGGDPLFVNLGLGDLHLQTGSPCIDAGTPVALSVDFDGNSRPQGAGFDMGAYETAGSRPQARQPQTAAVEPLTATLFPNPTTGAFTLSLDRGVTGLAQVFDLQGRLVASQPLNGDSQAQFDLGGQVSGAYLVRLVAEDAVLTVRVLVGRP